MFSQEEMSGVLTNPMRPGTPGPESSDGEDETGPITGPLLEPTDLDRKVHSQFVQAVCRKGSLVHFTATQLARSLVLVSALFALIFALL